MCFLLFYAKLQADTIIILFTQLCAGYHFLNSVSLMCLMSYVCFIKPSVGASA